MTTTFPSRDHRSYAPRAERREYRRERRASIAASIPDNEDRERFILEIARWRFGAEPFLVSDLSKLIKRVGHSDSVARVLTTKAIHYGQDYGIIKRFEFSGDFKGWIFR